MPLPGKREKTKISGDCGAFDGTRFFVQLNNMPVEGFVHIKNLKDDFYKYEAADRTLVGRRAGKVYRPGQNISVRVAFINFEKRKIDFVLA